MKPVQVIAAVGALLILALGGWYFYMQTAPDEAPARPQRGLFDGSAKTVKPAKAVKPTAKPIDPAAKPVDPATKPIDPAVKPVVPADNPADPAVKPVVPADNPADPAAKPADPVAQ